jgi:excinuclease ABC subunit B
MMLEIGYCPGIENYSRYFDGRPPGTRPFCLLDYFPKDYITIIDESHVTIPQLHAMYGGDHSRKKTLVEYGFRLPAAMDNRPLKFEEFENLTNQVIYMSATPGPYELKKTKGQVVEQIVRPTGLVDPPIEVRPTANQIDDLINEIKKVVDRGERVIVTTLTKRMAEELTKFLQKLNIKAQYIHSDIDTLKRVEIMENLRRGQFHVLVGINLLREGLDLPEVSLVAILDADKEGFLRSETSLTQVAGRAARNIHGKVIMYADKITKSMQKTIDETNRRRAKQLEYNKKHGITPKQVVKSKNRILSPIMQQLQPELDQQQIKQQIAHAILLDPVYKAMSPQQLKKAIAETRRRMEQAAKKLEFLEAARYRDEMFELEKLYKLKLQEQTKN